MYWQMRPVTFIKPAGHAGRTQVNLEPVFNISFIQQRSTGLQAGGLLLYWWLDAGGGKRRLWAASLHSCAATGRAFASSSRAPVSSCGSQWQDWEQGVVVSGTGWLLGSGKESVGGGEGDSVPGSEVGAPAVPPSWPLRFWTFLLSSFRSTLSARRSFSSRWTLPWSASNSRSREDFCRKHTHT